MTVLEYLEKNCILEDLEEISSYNDYWYSSYKFFIQNKHKDISELSPKQRDWLHKIVRGLMDTTIN